MVRISTEKCRLAALIALTGLFMLAAGTARAEYEENWESLRTHDIPEWFKDAKFGVWTVWGPHAVPAYGNEWYGHEMYRKGSDVYKHHVENYGNPSEFGYKDFFPRWKASNFDPKKWAELYRKSGARYAGLMAIYHDGLAKWDTDLTKWNTVNKGPGIDIVAKMEKTIKERDMKFTLCFHHGASYQWYTARGDTLRDKEWAKDYDIWNPKYEKLYWGSTDKVTPEFVDWWQSLITQAIDRFKPDLVWHDFGLEAMPEKARQEVVAYYYNQALKWGKDVDITHKRMLVEGVGIPDYERDWDRDMGEKYDRTWQTDTAVMKNSWGYIQNPKYKSVDTLIDGIVDRTSKNGNTMLAIGPKADGTIPEEQRNQLLAIGEWLHVNGEAIYGTRPWETAQEGQSLRFTTKEDALYAIALDWPEDDRLRIGSLARPAGKDINDIDNVRLLGHDGELAWTQDGDSLRINLPSEKPCKHAYAVKIQGSRLQAVPQVVTPDAEGNLTFRAAGAHIHGETPRYEKGDGKDNIGHWGNPEDYVSWDFRAPEAGTYKVKVVYSCAEGAGGSHFAIEAGGRGVTLESQETGAWNTFETFEAGTLELKEAGTHTLKVKPLTPPEWKVIGLKAVKLIPKNGDN